MSDSTSDTPNYDKSIPLQFELYCSEELTPFRDWLIDRYLESTGMSRTPGRLDRLADVVDLLLANLVEAYRASPACFVALPLNANRYTRGRYLNRSVSYANLKPFVDYLTSPSRLLATFKLGFYDRSPGGSSRSSRIKLDSYLLGALDCYRHLLESGFNIDHDNLLLAAFSYGPRDENVAVQLPANWIRNFQCGDIIRLKNADGKLIDYEDSDETVAMRDRLDGWNAFLRSHHIDLFLADVDIERLFDGDFEEVRTVNERRDDVQFLQLSKTRLHRVFNRSFELGGRFYGAWWQSVPSKLRPYVTIDNSPTREHDFSNLHAAMIYAKAGLALSDDAYSIEGVDPAYRKMIKQIFLSLINARAGQKIPIPKLTDLPPELPPFPSGFNFEELVLAVRRKHQPVAHYFHSDVGLQLQKVDAAIAEDVMLAFKRDNEVALPIHDSFIVKQGLDNKLVSEMKNAYERRIGSKVKVTVDPSFFDVEESLWTSETGEFPSMEEIIHERMEWDEYQGYRTRVEAWNSISGRALDLNNSSRPIN